MKTPPINGLGGSRCDHQLLDQAGLGDANQIAVKMMGADGWEVVSHDEVNPVSLKDLTDEDGDSFIRQACIDGAVFDFHTWSLEE